jgi:hypothetical protein
MKSFKFLFILLFLVYIPILGISKNIFVYHSQDNDKDTRKLYEIEVLKLALDKTIDKYGDYELIPSAKMNIKRAILTLQQNLIENFILKMSATKEFMDELSYANFPIDRGVLGYRVSFISPLMKERIKDINTLEELKKLSIGQGVGWLDTEILKYNGFNVKVISNYDGFFYMISLNRIDLFSRGINEILSEYKSFAHIKNLDYDRTFLLHYPLPRFFFAHKSNQKSIERIEKGLIIAFEDGSLDKLFDKYYKPSIDFLNLKDRKLYKLENPFLEGIDNNYEKYIFNPFKN